MSKGMSDGAPARTTQNNLHGALWVLIGGCFFVGTAALAKELGDAISVWQLLFVRQSVLLLISLPLLAREGLAAYRTEVLGLHLLRVFLAALVLVVSFLAFVELPLADATLLGFAKVLFVTAFAALLGAEVVGIRRATATLVGFGGVLLVVSPSGEAFNIYGVMAVLGAACAGLVMILVRRITRYDQAVKLILYQATLLGAVMIPPAIYYWVWPSLSQWAMLLGIGVISYGGQYCNISGYRVAEASFLAPFDYSRLLMAGLLAYWVFDEVPGWNALWGALLIVGASMYTVFREVQLKRSRGGR